MTERIAVIGAGAWGTTLARMLAAAEHPVTLWAHRPEAAAEMARDGENRRYLDGHSFPPGLTVTGADGELSDAQPAAHPGRPVGPRPRDPASRGAAVCRLDPGAVGGEGDRGVTPRRG